MQRRNDRCDLLRCPAPLSAVVTVMPGFGLHEIEPQANGEKIVNVAITRGEQPDF
ncbi:MULTISPECIES: hypothetical protein [Rhizobium]|uniref:Uncharacterized protein n=1 Tax=Rhizobium gallicum bv. gallicum R602sp TaxID=1041138 RepID=A0A0B4XH39_9HYPH|nr:MULTISPECIES: hypothetical protein [Rhizobium]AJD46040.1 hypothetical protein RGR602_PC02017 [Rhizobium gallicum bv. gallicum R602sp]